MSTITDVIEVLATTENDTTTRVVVKSHNHTFFEITLPKDVVDTWITEGHLAGHALQLMLTSHPASMVVDALYPVFDDLTGVKDPMAVITAKNRIRDIFKLTGIELPG